jgi:hypothetical protein
MMLEQKKRNEKIGNGKKKQKIKNNRKLKIIKNSLLDRTSTKFYLGGLFFWFFSFNVFFVFSSHFYHDHFFFPLFSTNHPQLSL